MGFVFQLTHMYYNTSFVTDAGLGVELRELKVSSFILDDLLESVVTSFGSFLIFSFPSLPSFSLLCL